MVLKTLYFKMKVFHIKLWTDLPLSDKMEVTLKIKVFNFFEKILSW